jgi:hypothetical protein
VILTNLAIALAVAVRGPALRFAYPYSGLDLFPLYSDAFCDGKH